MEQVHESIYISGNLGAEIVRKGQIREYFYNHYPYISFWTGKVFRGAEGALNIGKSSSKNDANLSGKVQANIRIKDFKGDQPHEDYQCYLSLSKISMYNDLFLHNVSYDDLLAEILSFDIIILNYPYEAFITKTKTDLGNAQRELIRLRNLLKTYPGKIFILSTPSPSPYSKSQNEIAKNVRLLARFLKSKTFLGDSRNISVFDLFDFLAYPDDNSDKANTLKDIYLGAFGTGLNENACKFVAKELIDYMKFVTSGLDKIQIKVMK